MAIFSILKSLKAVVATVLLLCLFAATTTTMATSTLQVEAFAPTVGARSAVSSPASSLNVFGKKKPKEDLSYIETRDMTREEMLELNKKNEDIMNMELQAMTGFSLVLSLPILYLCWVAFFSD